MYLYTVRKKILLSFTVCSLLFLHSQRSYWRKALQIFPFYPHWGWFLTLCISKQLERKKKICAKMFGYGTNMYAKLLHNPTLKDLVSVGFSWNVPILCSGTFWMVWMFSSLHIHIFSISTSFKFPVITAQLPDMMMTCCTISKHILIWRVLIFCNIM